MERVLLANHHHNGFCSGPSTSGALLPNRLSPARNPFGSLFLMSSSFPLLPLSQRCPNHNPSPIACISSSAFTLGAGGCSGGGSGGHSGRNGFAAHGTDTQSFNLESDDISIANSVEDYIFLDVRGMSCGGCASSVKKILESQPHVLHASVNLATETAVVKLSLGAELKPGKNKKELGEALAKHLSECGFMSTVREEPIGT